MTEAAEPRHGVPLESSIPYGLVPLESILVTEQLRRRPSRPREFEKENRALGALVSALADSPGTILQTLADKVLEVLRADSAGLSLLTKDERSFYWAAIAGAWRPQIGGGTPRTFGPCGDVLDRNTPMLFTHWERRYPYLSLATPLADEGLLVPFYVNGKAVGTIWAIAHDKRRTFDAEDLRLLESMGRFASAAYQAVESREEAESLAAERDAILRQIADGVVIADPSGTVVFANDMAKRLLGLPENGMHLKGHTGRYPVLTRDGDPFAPEELPLARAARMGDVVVDTELRIRHPDGTERVVLESAVPVVGEDGTRHGAVLTLHDVTAQRELERQKEEFFANASHDLRTPVTTIKASIDVVLENEPPGTPEPLHRLLTSINREAERMTTLVNDLLELTRLQTGRVHLDLAPHDLRTVAEHVASAIEPLANRRGQRAELVLPKKAIVAQADPRHLERALLNVLDNAHRYGREGGVIQLRLQRKTTQAVFSVEDDGPGIPEADQARIFERFYRPENEATRRDQGSGLGLPIARAMAELHGGRIWVESVPGHGATFRIALPVVQPAIMRRRKRGP